MKKRILSIVLVGVLLCLLSVNALAVGNHTVKSFEGATVVFNDENQEHLSVTLPGQVANKQYLVLVLKAELDENGDIKEVSDIETPNILYIDQTTADATGVVTFNKVFPKTICDSVICITGEGLSDKLVVGTIKAGFRLGDTNSDDCLDFTDAILVLQYEAGLPMAVAFNEAAGDVTGEGDIDFTDAIRILQHEAGLYTIPGWEE